MTTYIIPESLLQGLVNLLQELPARVSRTLLNDLEAECQRQDAERAQVAHEQPRQAEAHALPVADMLDAAHAHP